MRRLVAPELVWHARCNAMGMIQPSIPWTRCCAAVLASAFWGALACSDDGETLYSPTDLAAGAAGTRNVVPLLPRDGDGTTDGAPDINAGGTAGVNAGGTAGTPGTGGFGGIGGIGGTPATGGAAGTFGGSAGTIDIDLTDDDGISGASGSSGAAGSPGLGAAGSSVLPP